MSFEAVGLWLLYDSKNRVISQPNNVNMLNVKNELLHSYMGQIYYNHLGACDYVSVIPCLNIIEKY